MLSANKVFETKKKKATTTNPYVVQKVMSASPAQLISYVYDAGIKACALEDRGKALKSIQVLIQSLNYDNKEIAVNFYNVYRYLNYSISNGNFVEAKEIMEDLRSTWSQAMKVV